MVLNVECGEADLRYYRVGDQSGIPTTVKDWL